MNPVGLKEKRHYNDGLSELQGSIETESQNIGVTYSNDP